MDWLYSAKLAAACCSAVVLDDGVAPDEERGVDDEDPVPPEAGPPIPRGGPPMEVTRNADTGCATSALGITVRGPYVG